MYKNIKLAKTPRRLLTATMGFVFMISLSACTDNSNAPDPSNLKNENYKIGDFSISKDALWKEFKWSADSKLEEYINNVILNDEIQEITSILSKSELNDEEKVKYDKYSKRLQEYVIQDIYNFTYTSGSYEHELEHLKEIDKVLLEAKYVDELYSTYGIDISESLEKEDYLAIAKEFSQIYYPSYAKELFAYSKKVEEVNKADEEDENSEDEQFGHYSADDYVNEFKENFANQQDLDLLMIRFASKKEYEDTLRAFGIKVYDKKFYSISPDSISPADAEISYSEYCAKYDKINNPKDANLNDWNVEEIYDNNTVLKIFVQIYNYLYDGYRNSIGTKLDENIELKDLRSITKNILAEQEVTEKLDEVLVNDIKTNHTDYVHYTREELGEINSSLVSYAYNTLDLEKVMYSTSAQSYNDNYYLIFKLSEGTKEYAWYNSKLTNDEISNKFDKNHDEYNEALYNAVRESLINEDLTSSAIDTYVSDELENVKVKIYDEAVEISYGVGKEGYSKTHGKAKNNNILATIEYEDKVWNFNILENAEDENSVVIPGTNKKYSVYADLENQLGQTTAVDLIANEYIKNSAAYAETKENDREFYKDYIEALLYNFTNEAYSSSGFPASIGKYNFLMLYFHTANIDEIIDEFYCVQYASSQLLTDYSNDSEAGVINFLKSYTDKAYDNYFSLTGKRFVVYFDKNDDNEADDITTWSTELETLAKELIEKVMVEVYSSTDSHANAFTSVIAEINGSAKVAYNDNPALVENQWAKYRKAGLNVKLEDFTVTNSTSDVDVNLKNRLAAYVNPNGKYELIKNQTVPTEFIEKDAQKDPVKTKDGFNILLVTGATLPASAKWEVKDEETVLNNFVVNYNDRDVTIGSLYNENDKLTKEQIKLYVIQYINSGSSSLTPSSISSAVSSFLSPVLSRYTADETQRIIVKYFIESSSTEGHKLSDERFNKLLEINQRKADNYSNVYNEVFNGTLSDEYDQYSNWWTDLEKQVSNFLVNLEGQE